MILLGDCIEMMRDLDDCSIDAIVTDPPYNLTSRKKGGSGVAINLDTQYGRSRIGTGNGSGGFMGKSWDDYDSHEGGFQGWCTAWATECLRILKPAFEPVCQARKPLVGTVARNVLAHGTGALNIDACRIETDDVLSGSGTPPLQYGGMNSRPFHEAATPRGVNQNPLGRWPANVILDESQAAALDAQSGTFKGRIGMTQHGSGTNAIYGDFTRTEMSTGHNGAEDIGGASRFFYCAKAPKKERPTIDGVNHPTVKPLALMRWLVRLVTPPGGVVLDPFAGSGSTLEAARLEGFDFIGIERELDYARLVDVRLGNTYPEFFEDELI